MARPTYTWVLNPGAERELSPGTAPDQRTVAQMQTRAHLFDDLCAGEPRVWLEEVRARTKRVTDTARALLFCPTPDARKVCRSNGLEPQAAPPLGVLRRVLSKSFLSSALPAWTAPHHRTVYSVDEYLQLRETARVSLRAKRTDGYAGKGQRTLLVEERPGDRTWVAHNVRQGGLVVEAELSPISEFSVHGIVTPSLTLLGQPCLLHMDGARAPASVPSPCPRTSHAREIMRAGETAARGLGDAGYFGPFGLDLILTADGLFASDLNARFTLGFSGGLGSQRGEAISVLLSLPPS